MKCASRFEDTPDLAQSLLPVLRLEIPRHSPSEVFSLRETVTAMAAKL
jgi:hypothetical protein